jgi:alkane 1-monooxygenase
MKRLAIFALPFAVWPLVTAGGLFRGSLLYLSTLVLIGLVAESTLGRSRWQPNKQWEERWKKSRLFGLLPRFWLPVEIALVVWVLDRSSAGGSNFADVLGLGALLSAATGLGGVIVAHELMHSGKRVDWGFAEFLMAIVSYPHFCTEHVFGHHQRVATPDDSGTARFGQSYYHFYVSAIYRSVRSAWRIENRRLSSRQQRILSPRNRVIRGFTLVAVLHLAVFTTFGSHGWQVFAAQAVFVVAMIEAINYVQHYGLTRKVGPQGRYESIQPRHSWEARHRVLTALLFNLGRHSDHHMHARRPYQDLRWSNDGDAPQLPLGYVGSIAMALIPPLWFRVMHPLLTPWRLQDPTSEGSAGMSGPSVEAWRDAMGTSRRSDGGGSPGSGARSLPEQGVSSSSGYVPN